MTLSDEEIWNRAYNAAISCPEDGIDPIGCAEVALENHRGRWPKQGESPAPRATVSPAFLRMTVAQLRADNRQDAAKVLESLADAVDRGRASSWEPPPRG